jgi:hypothetical protein
MKIVFVISFVFTLSFINKEKNKAEIDTTEIEELSVFSFYSSSKQNGFHELELFKKYIDEIENDINQNFFDDKSKSSLIKQLEIIKSNYNISKEIAKDNLNFIIPSYSSIGGFHDDYNNLDDPQELLLENLIDKIINESDPINKGLLKNSFQYFLLNIYPFNENLFAVGDDYLNSETNSYIIKTHELYKILGENGFNRFKNNELLSDDWKKLIDHYKTEQIYNLNVRLIQTLEENLLYSTIDLNTVNRSELVPKFIRHYEEFRVNKIEDVSRAVAILIGIILFVFIVLSFGFKNFKSKTFSFDKENLSSDSLILISLLISSILSVYLLRLISPDINAFIGEFYTKFWIALLVVIPFILTLILSTLVHTKFSKSSSTDLNSKSRILFTSFVSPIIIGAYFINYSQLVQENKSTLLMVIFIFSILIPSKIIAGIIHKYQNKGLVKNYFLIVCVLIFINYLVSGFFLFNENTNLYFSLVLFIPLTLIGYKFNKERFENKILELDSNEVDILSNPFEYVKAGSNIDNLNQDLLEFINNDIDIAFLLKGKSKAGKTRFLKEFIKNNSSHSEFFYGDFDESIEGAIIQYEPFFQAFCQHYNPKYRLDKGFFNDRSTTFKAFKKVADIASTAGPIDLGSIISIDDNESLSVNEISGELLNFLIENSHDKNMVLILEDYQWVDIASNDLLLALINKIVNRGKTTSNIKIILTLSEFDGAIANNDLIISKSYPELIKLSNERIVERDLICQNKENFLNIVLRDNGFNYFNKEENIYFSQNLKNYLRNLINEIKTDFMPGNFFNYILALKNSNYLIIENSIIRLLKEPDEDFKFEDSNHIFLESKFNSLEEQEKQIIESAAHIGFKFDSTILSHIWKKDHIKIIQILEKIETYDIIHDDSLKDNIYVFNDRNFQRWLRSNYSKIEKTSHSQKVIEFQKRIIDSINSKGNEYVNSLDIDILKSISNRCNLFSNVEIIKNHSLKFNLITAKKLAKQNNLNQSSSYFFKIKDQLDKISDLHIEIILSTLEYFLKSNTSLKKLDEDVIINDENQNFLDKLFENLRTNSNTRQRSKSIIILLKDSYQRDFYKLLDKPELIFTEKQQLKRLKSLNELKAFISPNDLLEADTYYSLIDDKQNYKPIINFRKSAIANNDYDLALDIDIILSKILNKKKTVDLMQMFCMESLNILSKKSIEQKNEKVNFEFNEILSLITEILSNTNINFQTAKNTCIIISSCIEAYFIKKEYENVIELTRISESLITRIGEDEILYSIWPISGASCLFLNKIDLAEEYYFKHFNLLIKRGEEKEAFMHPLDGILHCCKEKNDYSKYNSINETLYKHLKYVSNSMKNDLFLDSKIDKKIALSDLLNPVKETSTINMENQSSKDLTGNIFKIIYIISKCDGHVDESEIHDLKESVNAINYSIGFEKKISESDINNLRGEIDKMNPKDYINYFEELCLKISDEYDRNTLKSIYHFCLDIAKADKIIVEAEQILLDIAKKKLIDNS